MEYNKKEKTTEEQILLYKDRGLIISDHKLVEHSLLNIGYYRLPPAWKSLSIITFGSLVKLYQNIGSSNPGKKNTAKFFDLHPNTLESWLLNINYIRNICAHHSRLWNKKLITKPQKMTKPKKNKGWIKLNNIPTPNKSPKERDPELATIYYSLSCMQYLIQTIDPKNKNSQKLAALFKEHPTIDKAKMGFPENWQEEDLWKLNAPRVETDRSLQAF